VAYRSGPGRSRLIHLAGLEAVASVLLLLALSFLFEGWGLASLPDAAVAALVVGWFAAWALGIVAVARLVMIRGVPNWDE